MAQEASKDGNAYTHLCCVLTYIPPTTYSKTSLSFFCLAVLFDVLWRAGCTNTPDL